MTPERWEQIEHLYHAAAELAAGERSAFLDQACAGEDELRREVESLLASHEDSGSFIESSPDDVVAGMIAEAQPRSMLGRTLGHYRISFLLGAGGMGEVYRARDMRLDRDVAVKILPEHLADNPDALHRFEREAKAVAALSHPNILAIHDFGVEEGVSYAVMELLEGETLRERLKRAPLDWREAVRIGIAIAEGLTAAHAKGIIHRDLKPENIFLTSPGPTSHGGLKILDFGIARVKHFITADSETLTSPETTKPGTIMGTIGYMSPEQVRGEEADTPSDLFSLGCVLYEMAGGQRPFAHATAAETIAAILKEEPPALAATGREIPHGLERLIRACLEKQPSARLQSAHDLAQGLKAIAGGRETQQLLPAQKRSRWRLAAMLGAATVVLLLAIALMLYLTAWREQAIDSLAVMPLVNASGDENAEYLSDGITEAVTNSLSQLPQLKRVIAQSTMASYKGKQVDPRKVGQELNVRVVLTGKIAQQGDAWLITAELVNGADGVRLWGQQYRKGAAEVIDVQTEIAKQISEKLNLSPTGEQKRQLTKLSTENAAAYQLYIKGRHYSNKWTAEGFNKGIDFMRQAVDLDPAYALAHAGLAVSYYNASSQIFPAGEAMPRARASAMKALQLDETLAEAHTVLALVKAQFEWNWSEAEKEFKRALALNEGYASAHQYYGFYLAEQGRMNEAIAEMSRAHELDPLSSLISDNLAWFYYLARRYDEATVQTQKRLAMDPNSGPRVLGLVYEQKGMFAQAIAAFEKQRLLDPENDAYDLALIGHAYALWGKKDQAQRLLDELSKRAKQRDVDPTCFAIIYAGLGDKDQAFAWLEKGYQGRWENMVLLKVEPLYDSLRSDARFTNLLRRMNLAP